MLQAIIKGINQLSDRRTRRYVWLSLGLALAVFIVLWISIAHALANTALFQIGWLETAIDVFGGLAVFILTWLLFPSVISAFLAFFLDGVAESVEAKHFPGLPPAPGQSAGEALLSALKFLTVMIVLNLLILPFLLLPPVFPLIFYSMNGYLLGREYFELVALRRLPEADAGALRKAHSKQVFLIGLIIAFALTVPLVNLLAPLIGTAAMVHLFEAWRSKSPYPARTGARRG